MRIRNIKNKEEILNNSNYYVKDPKKNKGKWSKVFNNDNEIHLEIGMGKGDFIIEMAKSNRNTNFIGIEKYESVLVRAVQKLENLKELYLRQNLIDNFDQIKYLEKCHNLSILALKDNPITQLPDYKKKIIEILPQLKKLDEDILDPNFNKNKNELYSKYF